MKRTHLFAAVLALATLGMLTADAAAYYHPTLGRFVSRDPGPAAPPRTAAAQAATARFLPRDPSTRYTDGMNLYQYVRSNPFSFVDPLGRDAWMTLSSAHAGIRVEVRSPAREDSDTVCGCLEINYHARGYGDGRELRSKGYAVFGERGYVQLVYRPGKCKETPYRLKGTPEQDRRLAKWAIEQVGETVEERLKDLSGKWKLDTRPTEDNRFFTYSAFRHRTCVQHAYEASRVYLGGHWIYRGSDSTVRDGVIERWGADVYERGDWMIPYYLSNFRDGVYHGEDNEKRRIAENKRVGERSARLYQEVYGGRGPVTVGGRVLQQ